MPQFKVTELYSNSHVEYIHADNVLDARDYFARKKGYENWGDMVVSYKHARNGLNKPPYSFREVNL